MANMVAWGQVLVAFLALLAVFTLVNAGLRSWSDRRWQKMVREQDRRQLRYKTWQAMARLGGW
jgi:hypothetical protein